MKKMKNNLTKEPILLSLLIIIIILSAHSFQACKSNGRLRGENPPTGKFNPENGSVSCKKGNNHKTYNCSPPVTNATKAVLTLNSFEQGGDGGGASKCDEKFHDDSTLVVALSTGWYHGGSRCRKNVTVRANGLSVRAVVVDECDSMHGCDKDHDYQPPCGHNIIDASEAVWKALGVAKGSDEWGSMDITWSD